MNTDSHFLIGKDHHICQDYAHHCLVNTPDGTIPTIALSDGCSSGGADKNGLDVDIGARFLAKIAPMTFFGTPVSVEIKNDGDYENSINNIWVQQTVEKAARLAHDLNIDDDCLFSTLLFGYIFEGIATIIMIGDGVCFFKTKTGLEYNIVSFPGNAPYYPYYQFKPKYLQTYLGSTTRLGESFGVATVETWQATKTQTLLKKETLKQEESSVIIFERPVEDLISFGIMSDGILSGIYGPRSTRPDTPADIHEMIIKATNVPNFNGPFVKRRLNKLIKDCRNDGIEFGDDVSLAIISLGG